MTPIINLIPFQNRYKNYAGISGRSVRCYWEQFNNHETECQDEVYMRVAEDVTYKLWELGNALKVYSRHTGGRVTTDLVNVVLKDMNVAPVLGANSSNWDTVDSCCDPDQDESAIAESFYFNSDRVVDLRDEYMKEYQMLQPGPTSVTSTWCVEDEVSEDLLDLFDRLGDGEWKKIALIVIQLQQLLLFQRSSLGMRRRSWPPWKWPTRIRSCAGSLVCC